ncbi:hypothetical protein [Cryptosporangium sp. NPDC051539]|uniref:hypothetical protein n=1 Tax=Cryptosporangium sp. NPDC051539 TaxID=3363962 RepID=UPI0037B9B955
MGLSQQLGGECDRPLGSDLGGVVTEQDFIVATYLAAQFPDAETPVEQAPLARARSSSST